MFHKIMLALDLSDHVMSRRLTREAVQMAQTHSAELYLLTVLPGASVPPMVSNYLPRDAVEHALSDEEHSLEDFIAAEIPAGLKVHPLLCVGIAHKKVLQQAEKLKPDLIIIGNHSRSRIQRYFLGSVAAKISEHCTCNLLILK